MLLVVVPCYCNSAGSNVPAGTPAAEPKIVMKSEIVPIIIVDRIQQFVTALSIYLEDQ